VEYSINNIFNKEECDSIIELTDSIGVPFSYNPNETWDCKRIYDESFKNDILNRLISNYKNNEFKLWFDLNEFKINDFNISLTKYYDNRWLDLHLDKSSQLTTVIVLSDEFSDGRFVLSTNNGDINMAEKYNLQIGDSISFDGSKVYHGVLPVHTGMRYALNIWMTNTDFKYKPLKNNKSII
jgi:predicted 2-oxoglutarate/Fe(II)-dependent dioxygenase YbiX